MSTSKTFDKICCIVLALTLLLTFLFLNGKALGIEASTPETGYESLLFDTARVHSLDIVISDWDAFLGTCENEEYTACNVVIDGEAYKNVGLRAKGNTSLSSVSQMGSSRYSFKIEFDQYESGKSYHGLDKLCLNNLIQDNTYCKDYLSYRLMEEFGAASPLCSFTYITVNGEDWGLYLAVEGVEDSFLQRNFGSSHGALYKPDSMSFGGGRGNGKDFDMGNFNGNAEKEAEGSGSGETSKDGQASSGDGDMPFGGGQTPSGDGNMPFGDGQAPSGDGNMPFGDGQAPPVDGNMPFGNGQMPPEGIQPPENGTGSSEGNGKNSFENGGAPGNPFGGGMGSNDVKLQYIDDTPESYANIFDNAKTDISAEDRQRLISSLKTLSSYEDLESCLDMESVLRYFVVHNFVVNGDSYTGSMIHNYYLYEKDGQLSMIPWDYNLAFGTFQGNDASNTVNDPIDEVLSDRPMQAWIFSDETFTQQYHELFSEFLASVDIENILDEAVSLIASYVEKDPTKFCTYEEFEAGTEALRTFCSLRRESVLGQLSGTIPSTDSGQAEDSSSLINAASLDLSAMGTMNATNGGMPGNFGRQNFEDRNQANQAAEEIIGGTTGNKAMPSTENMEMPEAPPGSSSGTDHANEWIFLGVSVLALLLGLIFTKTVKH